MSGSPTGSLLGTAPPPELSAKPDPQIQLAFSTSSFESSTASLCISVPVLMAACSTCPTSASNPSSPAMDCPPKPLTPVKAWDLFDNMPNVTGSGFKPMVPLPFMTPHDSANSHHTAS